MSSRDLLRRGRRRPAEELPLTSGTTYRPSRLRPLCRPGATKPPLHWVLRSRLAPGAAAWCAWEVDRFVTPAGLDLAFERRGSGPPVVLLHGFAATAQVNWIRPGVVDGLVAAGYQAIAPDLRGHGASRAPHRPEDYPLAGFLEDLAALLAALDLERFVVAGYSLGSRIALHAAIAGLPLAGVFLGGFGVGNLTVAREMADTIAVGMEADRPTDVDDRRARAFRHFADGTRSDRHALAAIQRALPDWEAPQLDLVDLPAHVCNGREDELAGPPEILAARLLRAGATTVAGNHMNAMLDPGFTTTLVAFADSLGRR